MFVKNSRKGNVHGKNVGTFNTIFLCSPDKLFPYFLHRLPPRTICHLLWMWRAEAAVQVRVTKFSLSDVQKSILTRRRKIFSRMSDVKKKLLATSHEMGPDCRCKPLKCFQKVDEANRNRLISNFNEMGTINDQNKYLSGLITINQIVDRSIRPSRIHVGGSVVIFWHRCSCTRHAKKAVFWLQ